ncbi:MAG: hypothetical protein KDK24_19935 [Pseudooceanicola sp.]|nr:hypothetical protein [Pseudooceanicola sp.]
MLFPGHAVPVATVSHRRPAIDLRFTVFISARVVVPASSDTWIPFQSQCVAATSDALTIGKFDSASSFLDGVFFGNRGIVASAGSRSGNINADQGASITTTSLGIAILFDVNADHDHRIVNNGLITSTGTYVLGTDTFVQNRSNGHDRITDFQNDHDKIGISACAPPTSPPSSSPPCSMPMAPRGRRLVAKDPR